MSTAFLEKGILNLLTLMLFPFSSFSVSGWVLSRLALSRCIQLCSEHNLGGHRWRTGRTLRTCLPMMPDGDWSYSPSFLFGIWGASIQSPGTASTSWQFSQDLPSEHNLWILWTDSACLCNCHSKVPQTGSSCLVYVLASERLLSLILPSRVSSNFISNKHSSPSATILCTKIARL